MTAEADPARPLLGLVMIVRDEARRIATVLASYRAHIDAWTILDTGSTDGTQALIREALPDVPGALHEEPFVDFARSRNRALELHGTRTVFSIMPNGDVLSGGEVLRAFLTAHRIDRAGAYRVRVTPGHYYHPLVMRTGTGWHYRGRTHECAIGPSIGPAITGVEVHRDRGARSDAEWRVRWMRDLDLLHRDLADDPHDPRPYFYLGQTHEGLGQPDQALACYEIRARLGGYFDEVFETKIRMARLRAQLDGPWAEVQQAYLEAAAHDPRRAEPLYAIAQHWDAAASPAIARVFAVAAAELPKPSTDNFLDEAVYTWRAAELAAITSAAAGRRADARHYAAVALPHCPDDAKIRVIRASSAPSVAELLGGAAWPIVFTPDPGWTPSNPSICADGDRIRCIVRTVNYRIVGGRYVTPAADVVPAHGPYAGWQVIRTRNFLLDLDADLGTTRSVELVDATGAARTSFPVHGFEDARLFTWRGAWWATATVRDFTADGRCEIVLLALSEDGAVHRADPLRGPWSDRHQKNWMSAVAGTDLKLVYAVEPSLVLQVTTQSDRSGIEPLSDRLELTPSGLIPPEIGRLRGGSQAVRVDQGWLCVVHDVTAQQAPAGRLYLHRFALLDDHFQLVALTDPFCFERPGIEFCTGLARIGARLVASYSVNDGCARLCILDLATVVAALRRTFVI